MSLHYFLYSETRIINSVFDGHESYNERMALINAKDTYMESFLWFGHELTERISGPLHS